MTSSMSVVHQCESEVASAAPVTPQFSQNTSATSNPRCTTLLRMPAHSGVLRQQQRAAAPGGVVNGERWAGYSWVGERRGWPEFQANWQLAWVQAGGIGRAWGVASVPAPPSSQHGPQVGPPELPAVCMHRAAPPAAEEGTADAGQTKGGPSTSSPPSTNPLQRAHMVSLKPRKVPLSTEKARIAGLAMQRPRR
jgi:hypothetical protein